MSSALHNRAFAALSLATISNICTSRANASMTSLFSSRCNHHREPVSASVYITMPHQRNPGERLLGSHTEKSGPIAKSENVQLQP